ncbi:futalosine hydrolase [Halalkalibacter nanhaiisediminis]|uniref:Futalosine hydrolase n=1 Tax=Halalkalibacter nanhaiisediminis TaxID=688079 RepID=A0A562QBA3_9BACI|nr:futalosine hydrolase [Halalkalibacter nanhaiisediminis]TWI53993.1 futalosine hydrolase [Halalkalibacter nanhaiisediminis]
MDHDLHKNVSNIDFRVLIMTSVSAERDAVLRGLGEASVFDVVVAGVGSAVAAASTAVALSSRKYHLVINAGIAGGFVGKAEVESIVVASEIVAADLGTESADGFISLDELNLGSSRIKVEEDLVTNVMNGLEKAGLSAYTGPILTLSTVTGTTESAKMLAERVEGATAEGMEGYGVAVAARQFGVPVMEIRAISNMVGPRDRDAWRIKEALAALEKASSVLVEVLR